MRNSLIKLSAVLAAIYIQGTSIANAETLPKLHLEVLSNEYVDDFTADLPDAEICNWWPLFCSDLLSIRSYNYKSSSIYMQNTLVKYGNGRPTCTKSITWNPKDVTLVNGTISSAKGSYTERCGSGPMTRGTTTDKPNQLHQQAFGPASLLPTAMSWENKLVTGNRRLTFNTQTIIKYDQKPSSLYATQNLNVAIGGQSGAVGGPANIPAGLSCADFKIGSTMLSAFTGQAAEDLSFSNKMKAVFGQPLLCRFQARLWELGDQKSADVTPRANSSKTKNQVFHYRLELNGSAQEK